MHVDDALAEHNRIVRGRLQQAGLSACARDERWADFSDALATIATRFPKAAVHGEVNYETIVVDNGHDDNGGAIAAYICAAARAAHITPSLTIKVSSLAGMTDGIRSQPVVTRCDAGGLHEP